MSEISIENQNCLWISKTPKVLKSKKANLAIVFQSEWQKWPNLEWQKKWPAYWGSLRELHIGNFYQDNKIISVKGFSIEIVRRVTKFGTISKWVVEYLLVVIQRLIQGGSGGFFWQRSSKANKSIVWDLSTTVPSFKAPHKKMCVVTPPSSLR